MNNLFLTKERHEIVAYNKNHKLEFTPNRENKNNLLNSNRSRLMRQSNIHRLFAKNT